jgi:hypothetical protein
MREPLHIITLEASSACYRDSFRFFFPFTVQAKIRFQVLLQNLRNYETWVGRNEQFLERATKSCFLNILSRHSFEKEGARAVLRYSYPLLHEQLKREGARDNLFRPEAMFPHTSLFTLPTPSFRCKCGAHLARCSLPWSKVCTNETNWKVAITRPRSS